ncbi:MAG TPA: tetratricopeptide repeat protein [Oculatellaceae cyanobacterium]
MLNSESDSSANATESQSSSQAFGESRAEDHADTYILKPNPESMIRLALGSAFTISTLMCIPDALGIIPVVPDPLTWAVRMLGLWLSAFILWFLGFWTMLMFAAFAGGGIKLMPTGLKLWRFGKMICWTDIKALTVDTQPLFSRAFHLKSTARRLLLFEEKSRGLFASAAAKSKERAAGNVKLSAQPIPSFQFSDAEFRSLMAYVSKRCMHFVPNSLDAYVFLPDGEAINFLKTSSEKGATIRKILSVVIAVGLVLFLARRASLNYFFNCGASNFRHEDYVLATKNFEIATRIDPTYSPGWDQLARSEFRCGDIAKAESYWKRALQVKPDFIEAKIGMSNIYLNRGEYEKARSLLNQCARLMPHNCAVYLNLAELFIKTGQPENARIRLQIIERESRDGETLARAAKLYCDLGDRRKALALLEQSVMMDPNSRYSQLLQKSLKSEQPGVPN